jgi:UDP-N-acetylmuramoylalanine--D-glutamate ligase
MGATSVRALIIGLAREGRALARFLAERGVQVTVTDLKTTDDLAEAMTALERWPIRYSLGGHRLSLLDSTDLVFVSPGVPLEIPLLVEARSRGLPLSSETRLFAHLCPVPIVGITGSNGKTTTTTLVGGMLGAAGLRTWVGGNIGRPLLDHLGDIGERDAVVMELSSFQLEFFRPCLSLDVSSYRRGGLDLFETAGWSPHIAALLNITPNHLDRHPTMQKYVDAKSQIIAHQKPGDLAILGWDSPLARQVGRTAAGRQRVLWFSMEEEVSEGSFLSGDRLILRLDGRDEMICRTEDLQLLGRHNVANTLAACAIAGAAGAPNEALRQVATTCSGVEHRLELIADRQGVRWYNDSIATSPERTAAALRAFDEPIVLLAGGRDKHLPWSEVTSLTWQVASHLILFGEAAGLIEKAMTQTRPSVPTGCQVHRVVTLEQAVELASDVARPGDVVLLSPGCTSFDSYQDFEARGEHFRELVRAME